MGCLRCVFFFAFRNCDSSVLGVYFSTMCASFLIRSHFRSTLSKNAVLRRDITERQSHIIIRLLRTCVNVRKRGYIHSVGQYHNTGFRFNFYNSFSLSTRALTKLKVVLGIETSCDDTGAAIVNEHGHIIAEELHSQTATHNETGGIIPNVAKDLHTQNVETVVQRTLESANMRLQDLDAIAVTVKPGLIMSLRVGLHHAQKLAHMSNLQLIPIHHMEAHALTARMIGRIDFPFLVLLASGGHCLLAIARDIDDFLLLGTSLDTAPGEAYDKTARELNLIKMPQFCGMSGGAAIEHMAKYGDHMAFPRLHVMAQSASCNFSFTGIKMATRRQILAEYSKSGLPPDELLPNVADICAWFQYNVIYHLARRLQRAFIFVENAELIGDIKTLVVSGGVASNSYIRANLQHICSLYNYTLVCPPQKLCTDNGIMIAWNGIEKMLSGRNYLQSADSLDVVARAPFGVDISKSVTNTSIKLSKLKLLGEK
uniref:N(6)-L-threonylcarbamoyladenine synthase n=3 Tax=Arion vulgaris TaxID=1028688 RepID=A0A0B7BCA4_9EUPU